jgi:hypothetical protein
MACGSWVDSFVLLWLRKQRNVVGDKQVDAQTAMISDSDRSGPTLMRKNLTSHHRDEEISPPSRHDNVIVFLVL